MSRHFSSDEISAIVAGDARAEAAAHLETCAACSREVGQFEEALSHFRGAVRDWSDSRFPQDAMVKPRTRFWPALAYAGIVALILIATMIGYRHSSQPESVESDTQLLKQVSADVSRSAPQGMETLLVVER